MKNFGKLLGIIALATIIGLSMMACGGDDDGDGGGNKTPTVGQLPDFPAGSTPAESKEDAEAILAELSGSYILSSIEYEIWEVVDENVPRDSNSYNIKDKSLPNGSVKVSASGNETELNTGGFKTLSDNWKAGNDLWRQIDELYDAYPVDNTEIDRLYAELDRLYEEMYEIRLAKGDKANYSGNENAKGELTKAITDGDVTVAKGSTYEMKGSYSENITVAEAGNYPDFKISGTYSEKQQIMAAFTVTTSSGSVKVIFDMSAGASGTATNAPYEWKDDDPWTRKETYSGSLKVYGSNNKSPLIDHKIVDEESLDYALQLLGYYDGGAGPDYAMSAKNVKGNENISSQGHASLLKKTRGVLRYNRR